MNIESPIDSKTIRQFRAESMTSAVAERECLLARHFCEGTLNGESYALSFLPSPHAVLKERPDIFLISGQLGVDNWQLELPVNACLDLMQDIEPLLMPTNPAEIAEAARCFIQELARNNLPAELKSKLIVSAETKAALPGASHWPFRVRHGHRWLVAVLATSENLDLLMKKYTAEIKKDHSDIKNRISSEARIRIATYRTTRPVVESIQAGDIILIENFSWNACSILVNDYIQLDCRIDGTDMVVTSITEHQVGASKVTNRFISFEEADQIMQDDPWAIGDTPTELRDVPVNDDEHDLAVGVDLGRTLVEIVFDAGRVSLPLSALETIAPGYVFQLENTDVGVVSMLIAGKHIGKAEIVEVDGKAGFRILEIIK
jgi:flagellar motor switch/type III secretory pathway protein FliN